MSLTYLNGYNTSLRSNLKPPPPSAKTALAILSTKTTFKSPIVDSKSVDKHCQRPPGRLLAINAGNMLANSDNTTAPHPPFIGHLTISGGVGGGGGGFTSKQRRAENKGRQ